MKKSDILAEAARRLGDEDATFISSQLSKGFDFVLMDLSQDGCLSLLRKETSVALNNAGCVAANNVLNVNTATVLSLGTGILPERIGGLTVPAWGVTQGQLQRLSDQDFVNEWLTNTSTAGRPKFWRTYPTLAQVQLWPAPDSDNVTASCLVEWWAPPTTLSDNTDITEILISDMGTILAGLYYVGGIYRDEALNDLPRAQLMWEQGKQRMRERITKSQFFGRRNQIRFVDF